MQTELNLQQKLSALDDHLFKTIAMVQEIICDDSLPQENVFNRDEYYQRRISELYNLVKIWVENR